MLKINNNWYIDDFIFRDYIKELDIYVEKAIETNKNNVLIIRAIEDVLKIYNEKFNLKPEYNMLKITYTNGPPVTLNREKNNAEISLFLPNSNYYQAVYQFSHELFHFCVKKTYCDDYNLNWVEEIFACLASELCFDFLNDNSVEKNNYFQIVIAQKYNAINIEDIGCYIKLCNYRLDYSTYKIFAYIAHKIKPIFNERLSLWPLITNISKITTNNLNDYFSQLYNFAGAEQKLQVCKISYIFGVDTLT
jgi:hypothetical protein